MGCRTGTYLEELSSCGGEVLPPVGTSGCASLLLLRGGSDGGWPVPKVSNNSISCGGNVTIRRSKQFSERTSKSAKDYFQAFTLSQQESQSEIGSTKQGCPPHLRTQLLPQSLTSSLAPSSFLRSGPDDQIAGPTAFATLVLGYS